jgi:glycosyltransferase involved in cell wall biosynthesis
VARGVQNKVLEALAMNLPVLATSAAAEGIHYENGNDFIVVDEPQEMALEACKTVTSPVRSGEGREWVKQRYDWSRNLLRLSAALDG